MNDVNFKELILSKFVEPTFYVNSYKIGRPNKKCSTSHQIQKTNGLHCWRIEHEKLIKIQEHIIGILFDAESYIVQWLFDLKIDDQVLKETATLVYYWKGQNAVKGNTPLPSHLEEHCPVERIVQWSEPAIFFHSFQKTIVFSGKEEKFDFSVPHLLLARGEISDEIHFYEVSCKRASLRSRASFLLIIPEKQCFLYWHGSQTSIEERQRVVEICPHNYLKKWQNSWSNFLVHEQEEDHETNLFLDTVQGDHSDYFHVQLNIKYSPKLFYLNTITGTFLATEIEYPLRAAYEIATFPFLQNHLYTAIQPALFLIDNNSELWLWEGTKNSHCDNKAFEEELKFAKALQTQYAEEKGRITADTVKCFHIHAYKEPQEFKNIFPMWVDS